MKRPEAGLMLTWGDVWMFWLVAKLANIPLAEDTWRCVLVTLAIITGNYLLVWFIFGGPEHQRRLQAMQEHYESRPPHVTH